MNKRIVRRFERAGIYLERVGTSIRKADPVQGMADAAELGYQAQEIYREFEVILKAKRTK